MLDSRPGQVLNLPAPRNAEDAAQHKRIFEKVWFEVDKVVNEFKLRLGEKLSGNASPKGVEEIEKTIESVHSFLSPSYRVIFCCYFDRIY